MIRGRRLIDPLVDDLGAINPDPDAVIGSGREGVTAGGKTEAAGPARRELIDADAVAGTARSPVIINRGRATGISRGSAERRVVEVLGQELARRAGGRDRKRRARHRARVVVGLERGRFHGGAVR